MEDVLRHRLANGSHGGSSHDMSINEDKASMLVHVSTPAASLHNLNSTIPTYSTVSIPGGEDDLDPDYQELNTLTDKDKKPQDAVVSLISIVLYVLKLADSPSMSPK